MKLLPVLALIVIIFFPDQASAAGFISCDGANVNGLKECSACDFAVMGNTILKWLIGVLFMVFAIMAAAAGFGLVTSGGNPQAKTDAKNKLVNAIVGIIIVLAAWLLVDTVMRGLLTTGPAGQTGYISGYGPWSQIQCQNQAVTTGPTGSLFPLPPVGSTNSYQMYEHDTVNNCKIPHSNGFTSLSACQTAQGAVPSPNYTVVDCSGVVTPVSSYPSWSSDPVCGSPVCSPLTPYTGPDPLGVTWSGADPGLQNCAQKFAASAGGSITSAFRPQVYQDHLKEIHTKWCTQGLSSNTSPGCATVKSAVAAEMVLHGLNCSWPVANVSNHTSGLAVDISFPGGDPGTGLTYGLTWFGSGDPVHYTFTAGFTCP